MKSNFYILFKTYKDKQLIKQQQLAKQAKNYKAAERKEDSEFEQKPVLKFNEFNAKHKFLMKNVWRKLKKNNWKQQRKREGDVGEIGRAQQKIQGH